MTVYGKAEKAEGEKGEGEGKGKIADSDGVEGVRAATGECVCRAKNPSKVPEEGWRLSAKEGEKYSGELVMVVMKEVADGREGARKGRRSVGGVWREW